MAEQIVPRHKAQEQLRTEAPKQKEHTDKYVSAFVSGAANTDMTFKNPLLSKSADYYKVGIDELTVNMGGLSMLEYDVDDVLFRVVRRGLDAQASPDFLMIDAPAAAGAVGVWRDAFEFRVDRIYLTLHEILERCREIAVAVGTVLRDYGLQNIGQGAPADNWTIPWAAGAGNFEHFRISITPNGQLRFSGNRIFWANFAIEVPVVKYRQIIFGDITQQYLSMHPATGAQVPIPYTVVGLNQVAATLAPGFNGGAVGAYGDPNNTTSVEYVATGNLLNTIDRRVTLEVGCSLPIKNSPLIDHGVEAPDFVLGRYMFHQPYSMKSFAPGILDNNPIPEITVPQLGTITVQGPRDRVVFHHLMPQQKIQTLRLRLWARVRTYDETQDKWGMKTIMCPVQNTDYWHVRLHFAEK